MHEAPLGNRRALRLSRPFRHARRMPVRPRRCARRRSLRPIVTSDTMTQMAHSMTAQMWPQHRSRIRWQGRCSDAGRAARCEFESALSSFTGDRHEGCARHLRQIFQRGGAARSAWRFTGRPTGAKALKTMPQVTADITAQMMPRMQPFQARSGGAAGRGHAEARLQEIGRVIRRWRHCPRLRRQHSNHFFLGVERSATGRAWRDRLDERGAGARAGHRAAPRPAGTAGARAGRPRRRGRRGRGLSRPHRAPADARSARAHRNGSRRRARIADAVTRGEKRRDFRRLRRRWRHRLGAAGALSCANAGSIRSCIFPDRIFEGYGPNVEAIRSLRRARRDAAGHRRLRHHQHRSRSAEAKKLGLDAVVDRSSPGRRGPAAGAGDRQSQPARRSLRARPSRRRRAGVPHAGGGEPRSCASAASGRRRGRSPICCRCSIWSRSAPSPTWCRSRASTAPSSPRG